MSQIQPLVSIVIPNYNNARFLTQCLESCIHQSYCNLEIIVVDDCSSDESVQIIEGYAAKDSRIRLIQNETNQKVSRTRDRGIRTAKAEWITTLDSDDFYITKDKIKREVDVIQQNANNHNIIAFSGVCLVGGAGRIWHASTRQNNMREGRIFEYVLSMTCPIPRDYLFSKKQYFEAGGLDLTINLWEDWDLTLRLAQQFQFIYAGDRGIGYRQTGSGLSSVDSSLHLRSKLNIFEKHAQKINQPHEIKEKLLNPKKSPFLERLKLAVARRVYK